MSSKKIAVLITVVVILLGAIIGGVVLLNQSKTSTPVYKDINVIYDGILLENKGSQGKYIRSECRDMQFIYGLDHSKIMCGPEASLTLNQYFPSPQIQEFIRNAFKSNTKFSGFENKEVQGNRAGNGYIARISFHYGTSDCLADISADSEKKTTGIIFSCVN